MILNPQLSATNLF